jgi:hypothetical protein
MTVGARVSLPPDSFPLAPVFERYPGARLALERAVPLAGGVRFVCSPSPDGPTTDDLAAVCEACDAVASARPLAVSNGNHLILIEWAHPVPFLETLVATDAVCLDARGVADGWGFRLRFPDREALGECYRACAERGLDVTVRAVQSPAWSGEVGPADALTPGQREALRAAFETGYFRVPREATLAEVADALGVSDTAVSQRLRRGVERLVDQTVLAPD